MVVDNYISEKIRRLEFLAVVMIVVIHSSFMSKNMMVCVLTQWAVPFFLCVSGCLFAASLERNSLCEVVKKKIKTLVVPYLFWGTLGWVVIGGGSFWYAYGILTAMPTGLGVLWFLRQLVVSMVVLSLVTKFTEFVGCRKCNRLISMSLYCLFFLAFPQVKWIVAMPASPFWFIMGYAIAPAILADKFRVKLKLSYALGAGFALLAVLCKVVGGRFGGNVEFIIRNGCDLLMIVALWFFYDGLFFNKHWVVKVCEILTPCTFGVYCVHMFFIRSLQPLPTYMRLIITLLISVIFVLGMGYVSPSFSSVIFGGRFQRSLKNMRSNRKL